MIPDLDENGNLPPGVHPATLNELIARFGQGNETRLAMGESLSAFARICHDGGAIRLAVNGSFVTRAAEPNDVDCIVLLDPSSPRSRLVSDAVEEGVPYLSIQVTGDPEDWTYWMAMFTRDRQRRMKGIVEVIL